MELFDSHCHLEDERFQGEVQDVLGRMAEVGVTRCILASSDMPTGTKIVALADQYPQVYGMVGFHPHEASQFREEDLSQMAQWLKKPKIVGVGEIGLDYYYDHSPRDVQRQVLERQLDFALEQQVPVAFHIRDAHGDTLDMLSHRKGRLPEGVLHCFSGSLECARQYLDMGFYLSFAGPVTFKNAAKLQEVAKYCPTDRLLVETDSPYLAPVPLRGQRNEPANVRYVAQMVAELKGMDAEELARKAFENTCRLYRIPMKNEVG
ncbi:MAG: TatD family hydrolase [Clostridia bacterium]|nr:TatD family hydrolase [Clostridia bacterium]